MFPHTHPYTNRAAACTCGYNGRYSRTSSRRECTPSRINGIRKDSQKDVDWSGKALSTDWTCSYWIMPHENDTLIVRYVYKIIIYIHSINDRTRAHWQIFYTWSLEEGWNQWPVEWNYCFASERPFQSNIWMLNCILISVNVASALWCGGN